MRISLMRLCYNLNFRASINLSDHMHIDIFIVNDFALGAFPRSAACGRC